MDVQPQFNEADLANLNDKDKADLRQFLNGQNSKARIQSTVHSLTDVCFKKCVTAGSIRSGKLDSSESSCMTNCAERFLDISQLTVQHLGNMKQ